MNKWPQHGKLKAWPADPVLDGARCVACGAEASKFARMMVRLRRFEQTGPRTKRNCEGPGRWAETRLHVCRNQNACVENASKGSLYTLLDREFHDAA